MGASLRRLSRSATTSLSEADGPAGYEPSDWLCIGAPVTNGTVSIALDQDVTCTITNTAVAPTLTLVKQVTNTVGRLGAADRLAAVGRGGRDDRRSGGRSRGDPGRRARG